MEMFLCYYIGSVLVLIVIFLSFSVFLPRSKYFRTCSRGEHLTIEVSRVTNLIGSKYLQEGRKDIFLFIKFSMDFLYFSMIDASEEGKNWGDEGRGEWGKVCRLISSSNRIVLLIVFF